MIGKKWGLDPSIVSAIVHGALLPMVYYASPIWASVVSQPNSLLILERITRQLGLLISGCLKTTSYPAVYTLSGLRSPELEIIQRLVMFGRRQWSSGQLQNLLSPPTCTNSSKLSRRLNSEVNRIQRETGMDDLICAPKQTAWGIAPHESDLLIQPRDLSSPFAHGEGRYFCTLYRSMSRLSSAWSWRHVHASHEGRIELPVDSDDDQAEAIGILTTIKSICTAEKTQEPPGLTSITFYSRCTRLLHDLIRLQNLPTLTYTLQLWIRDMKLSGTNVFWTRPGNLCDISPWLRTTNLARDTCDTARNLTNHTVDSTFLQTQEPVMEHLLNLTGQNHKKIRKALKSHLDQRMNSWLIEQTETGCAVTDLIRERSDFRFIGNYFPSYGLSRTAGSALSQFLSVHMPTRCYLESFNLAPASFTRSHDFWEEHLSTTQMVRDHLLFACSDVHVREFRSRCLSYFGALSWSVALGDLASLAEFAMQIHSEAWLRHRFFNDCLPYQTIHDPLFDSRG